MDWLDSGAGNYADPINHSYGADTSGILGDIVSARLDESVDSGYDTNVVAAGNNGEWVEIPAIAYNVIAVGNIDDRQTRTWDDDVMRASSSYRDPVSSHSDREKPEVSAAGTELDSATTSSPWIGYAGTGTSYASAIVAAAATGLHEVSDTGGYPELAKAVLMATAWNNVEGNWWLSDVDGAGGIDAFRAFELLYNNTNGGWGTGYHECAAGNEQIGSFWVEAGKKVRIVLAWSTNPDYAGYVNAPSSDWDLGVQAPNGATVYSASWDNTYEIVYWLDSTPATGTYQVWLYDTRCDEPSGGGYWAWAWAMDISVVWLPLITRDS